VRPKKEILYCSVGVILAAMLVFIAFGDNGLKDLSELRDQREGILAHNKRIFNENISLYRQMKRLESDPLLIEATARKELSVIGADERIISLK
jgi:cell division protein FtsB